MKYIINNTVIFVEDDGIYLKDSTEVEVKLSSLSSRILSLLIENKGKPVSRDMIYKLVWEDYGLAPSNTSLNNNISFLRKSLRDCGVDDFIVTIPKIGISIEKSILIDTINNEEVITKKSIKTGVSTVYFYMLLPLLSLFLFIFFLKNHNGEKNSSLNYIGVIDKCNTYTPKKTSINDEIHLKENINKFMSETGLKCSSNNILLVNAQGDSLKNKSKLAEGMNFRNSREFYSICDINNLNIYSCDNYYYLKSLK
ncbi:Transcriptional regulatory protein%2C C terminal [Yersinia aldovae]|uniref:Transcriptional regulatory protein, C terminal n=2 Tax=Yersinia aldovae TaxID=29483 RepID=A0A0T9UDJ1_YERAL|nr:winged helix-turn-helix domain-containing protein [Yersinia aldovae]CNJ07850.1 Transcriptional regulatory protein%2C C terminal [Yersinia aldovae]CNL34646.1 Transcriptional regulatory protein%2C C terminal [Yersinia aldovae]CNL38389.1 Transcriptional regulatory protein%2C C terminal [Yersinia aldovae]